MLTVWANGPGVPGQVCSDARLTDQSRMSLPGFTRPMTAEDQVYGQAGWDIGLAFRTLADLGKQLHSLSAPTPAQESPMPKSRGRIARLAIHLHGHSGELLLDGTDGGALLRSATVRLMVNDLAYISTALVENPSNPATILLAGCIAGQGRPGTDLLIELSRVWRNRKVVGFATIGFAHASSMIRKGKKCTEPGMRDTDAQASGEADKQAGRKWSNLAVWPWADERSPRAKVALNGSIIRGAQW